MTSDDYEILRTRLKEVEAERDDLMKRFKRLATQATRRNISPIEDLSDPNRPVMLVNAFFQLYSKEWAIAYDFLNKEGKTFETICTDLFKTFEACFDLSVNEADLYRKELVKVVTQNDFPPRRKMDGNNETFVGNSRGEETAEIAAETEDDADIQSAANEFMRSAWMHSLKTIPPDTDQKLGTPRQGIPKRSPAGSRESSGKSGTGPPSSRKGGRATPAKSSPAPKHTPKGKGKAKEEPKPPETPAGGADDDGKAREGCIPIFVPSKTQEIFHCRADVDVTQENQMTIITKQEILDDLHTCAGVSDFHPFNQQIIDENNKGFEGISEGGETAIAKKQSKDRNLAIAAETEDDADMQSAANEFMRSAWMHSLKTIPPEICKEVSKQWSGEMLQNLSPYILKCAEMCWLMSIQVPPIKLDFKINQDDKFDPALHRAYDKTGNTIAFPVWPIMFRVGDKRKLAKGIVFCKNI